MSIGELSSHLDLLAGGVEISVTDVLGNRVVKKEGLLRHGADMAAQGVLGGVGQEEPEAAACEMTRGGEDVAEVEATITAIPVDQDDQVEVAACSQQ